MDELETLAFTIVLILIGGLIIFFGNKNASSLNDTYQRLIKTEAIVTDVKSNSKKDSGTTLYLSYEVDGTKYTKTKEASSKYEKGDILVMYYDAEEPENGYLHYSDGKTERKITIGFGCVFIGVGLLLWIDVICGVIQWIYERITKK